MVSCDTRSDDRIEGGTYEATLPGDGETTRGGQAYFTRTTSDPNTGGEVVTLFLVDVGGDPILTVRFDPSPQNELYRLSEDGAPKVLYRDPNTGVQRVITSGGLTVATYSGTRLAGAIEATLGQAASPNDPDPSSAQILALFDADIRL
ncbi:MAG: hypothetical protein Rubg2KO_03630 [Rubricoccaceae bacterium]